MLLLQDETPIVDKLAKKRPAAAFEEEAAPCAVGYLTLAALWELHVGLAVLSVCSNLRELCRNEH